MRDLISKGVLGGWVGFMTDDCRKTYDELEARGVEFVDGPPSSRTASTPGSATRSATS